MVVQGSIPRPTQVYLMNAATQVKYSTTQDPHNTLIIFPILVVDERRIGK